MEIVRDYAALSGPETWAKGDTRPVLERGGNYISLDLDLRSRCEPKEL